MQCSTEHDGGIDCRGWWTKLICELLDFENKFHRSEISLESFEASCHLEEISEGLIKSDR